MIIETNKNSMMFKNIQLLEYNSRLNTTIVKVKLIKIYKAFAKYF